MKKVVLLCISGILLICSISLIFSRILIPIKKNKEIVSNRIYYTESLENEDDNTSVSSYEKVEIDVTDGNISTVYVGNFMNKVNFEKYSEAYEMLSKSFKEINFPSLETFEKYWKENYNEFLIVEYLSYERMGDFILVKVNLTDRMKKKEPIEQIFTLVKEGNNYKISFGLGE